MATTPPETKTRNDSRFGAENREKIFNFYAVRENWSKLLIQNSSPAREANKECLEQLIEKELASGNFGKAHIYLHCLKDNAQGKYSFYSEHYEENGQQKKLDMPIWFRDARSDAQSQSSKTDVHDLIMKGLSYLNMTLTLFRSQNHMILNQVEVVLKKMAVNFFSDVINSKNLNSATAAQKIFDNCLGFLVDKGYLNLDKDTAKNLLLKSLDLANLELPLCAKATVTKHEDNEILDIDVPIYELSAELKNQYEKVLSKNVDDRPDWFKAQNPHLQKLIAYYAPAIIKGQAIPADCQDILPGIRNAAEDRLYLYRKNGKSSLIYRGYHTGNLGHNIMGSQRFSQSPWAIISLLVCSLGALGFAIAACVFPLIPVFAAVFIPAIMIASLLGFYAIYHLNAKDNVDDEDLHLTSMAAEQLKEHVDSKYLFVNTLTSPSIFEPAVNYLENQVEMAMSDLNTREKGDSKFEDKRRGNDHNKVTSKENFYSNTPVNPLRRAVSATNLHQLNQLYKKLDELLERTKNPDQNAQIVRLQNNYLELSHESSIFDSESVNLQLAATIKQMAALINANLSEDRAGHKNLLTLVDACKGGRDRGGLSRFLAKVNAIFEAINRGDPKNINKQDYLQIAIKMALSGHVQSQCDLGSKRGNGGIKKVTGDLSVPDFLGKTVKKALVGEYEVETSIKDSVEKSAGENKKESKDPEGLPKLDFILSKVSCFRNGPIITEGPGKAIAKKLDNGMKKESKSESESFRDDVNEPSLGVPRSSMSVSSSEPSRNSVSQSGSEVFDSSCMFWKKPDANPVLAPRENQLASSNVDGQSSSESLPTSPSVSINFSCV